MFHPFSLLKTAGLGAGIMYFFDPELGARRRAKIKDRLTQVQSATTKKAQEKAQSLYDDATHRIDDAKSGLHTLVERSDSPMMQRLQDSAAEIGKALGIKSEHWTPTTKTAVALGGVGLAAALLKKRDLAALALGIAGIVYSKKSMDHSQNDYRNELPSLEGGKSTEKVVVHNL